MVGTLISRRWNNNGHVSPKDGGPAGKPVAPWPLIFIKFFSDEDALTYSCSNVGVRWICRLWLLARNDDDD